MRLSILLVTQPARVARSVAFAGIGALVAATLAVGGHPLAGVASAAALLGSGVVLGVLAPLYGRTATAGLWVGRAGIAIGALAVLLPHGNVALAIGILASIVVAIGLQTVVRRARGLTDLPAWSGNAVGAGIVAAVLVPSLGGGVALAFAWLAVAVVIRGASTSRGEAATARA